MKTGIKTLGTHRNRLSFCFISQRNIKWNIWFIGFWFCSLTVTPSSKKRASVELRLIESDRQKDPDKDRSALLFFQTVTHESLTAMCVWLRYSVCPFVRPRLSGGRLITGNSCRLTRTLAECGVKEGRREAASYSPPTVKRHTEQERKHSSDFFKMKSRISCGLVFNIKNWVNNGFEIKKKHSENLEFQNQHKSAGLCWFGFSFFILITQRDLSLDSASFGLFFIICLHYISFPALSCAFQAKTGFLCKLQELAEGDLSGQSLS